MTKRALALAAVAAAAVLAASAGTGRAGTATYTITDLGSLGGSPTATFPHAINNLGQIAGETSDAAGHRRAFLWAPTTANGTTGSMTDLGDLGAGPNALATGIDDAGDVVGDVSYGTDQHAFYWTNDKMYDLGPGDARGISAGVAVGDVYGSAVYWTGPSAKSSHSLGTLGGVQAGIVGVNSVGGMAAYRIQSDWPFPYHALLVDGGSVTDLGTLPGGMSFPSAVDDHGDVVGYSAPDRQTNSHAFLWRADGSGMVDLGTLGYNSGNASASRAYGINDNGQIVGDSYGFDFRYHAFLWQDGKMTNLDTLLPPGSGWQLERASAINNAGQIVGYGLLDGTQHGFLLTPGAPSDTTPPVSSATASPAANAAGWNNGAVTVEISATDEDGGSGVASVTVAESGAQNESATTTAGSTVDVPVTAEGETTITYHATDNAGNVEGDHTITVRIDETAPVVTVPAAGIAADADTADGTPVDYATAVAAHDNLDPSPSLDCVPASGSLFPIGQTQVTCTSSDQAGNTATATFTITVRGAADQIAAELASSTGGLGSKQQAALADVQAGDTHAACGVLGAYANEVRAQDGKKLSDADAAALLATVARVENLLGC